MIKRTFLFLLASFIFLFSSAQEFIVNGYIKDARTQEPIIGAAVFEANTVTNGTPTDTEGYFSLDFNKADIYLKVGYIGYVDTVLNLQLTSDTSITVFMRSATDIETVEIDKNKINWKPKDNSLVGESKDVSARNYNIFCEMKLINPFVPSMIKQMKIQNDLAELFYRKGNGSNQALTYIDGARLYSAKQSLNFTPLIEKSSIKSFNYFYEKFPSKYGAFISPVIDISMKEADYEEVSGSATISLYDAKFNMQTPILSGKSSLFVAGGISYFNNPYTDLFRKNTENQLWIKPSNFNLFAKYTHQLTENDKVFTSFFINSNKNKYEYSESVLDSILYVFNNNTSERTTNTLASAHWEHVFSPNFISKVYLTYSAYNLKQNFIGDTTGLVGGLRSDISNFESENKIGNSDIAFNLNFKYNAISDHNIEFGASATNHNFKQSKGSLMINDFSNTFHVDTTWKANSAINAQEYIAFAEDRFEFSDELTLQAGLHFSTFVTKNKTYLSLQPRFFAKYDLFDWLSLNISYSNYKQYIHFLSNRYAGLKSDVFIPSDEDILPSFTHHASIGSLLKLPFGINLTSDFYYENTTNVVEYKDKFGFFNNDAKFEFAGINLKDRLEQGKENTFGGRIILNKDFENISIKVAHYFSLSSREFKALGFPNDFAYTYNNTHDFNLNIKYNFNEDFSIGINWMYKSGNYITPDRQSYLTYDFDNGYLSALQNNKTTNLLDGNVYSNSGDINSYKLPAYHRADFFINYSIDNHVIGLTIYNVYNRKNTDFVDFKRGTITSKSSFNLTNYTTLPFLPVLTYTYKFE